MPLLAVDGDEELGLDQGVDDLQLLLAGVAGDVEGQLPLVHHLGALAVELVDHVADGVLVAGDGGGGDDHPVAGHRMSTWRWVLKAMRVRADMVSPWLPVVMMHTLFLGRDLMWFKSISTPSGMFI